MAANASCAITLEFAPLDVGAANGTVIINAANATVTNSPVSVSGVGISRPIASVSPTPLAFGDLATNTTATLDLTLSNTGNASLTGITLGAFPDGFSRSVGTPGTCGTALAAPAGPGLTTSCTITVEFTPTEAIEYSGGAVSITADGGVLVTNSPVPLSGSGMAPQGTVAFVSASIGTLNAAGTELDFGAISGTNDSTVTLRVSGDPVTFGAVIVDGGNGNRFRERNPGPTGCQDQTIAAGDTCTVVVRFIARNNVERAGTLTVNHDGTGGPQILSLLGQ